MDRPIRLAFLDGVQVVPSPTRARHDLVAYGLDTVATVELNGRVLGRTQNMHRGYRFDVRELLRDGDNTSP